MQVRVRGSGLLTAVFFAASILSCAKAEKAPVLGDGVIVTPPGGDASTGPTCSRPGQVGCPCDEIGAAVECGKVLTRNGDYVTCSLGRTTCQGNVWGPCIGNHIVAQSVSSHALGASGLHTLSTATACTNVCDPGDCKSVQNSSTDVDASGVTLTDAGVSIALGAEASTGGGGPCTGLWCQLSTCDGGAKTTVTGTVYDPAGKNPLYNAFVYIPVSATAPLPPFTSGASCDTCAGTGSISAISVAQTGPDGKFTLSSNVPVGSNIPLVIQMGKWRRKVTLPSITACTTNNLAATYTRLPKNRFDGDGNQADIPKMAIASGSADPFECLLLKAGIDASEIQAPGNGARIDYYVYNGVDRFPGGAPAGSTLTGSTATLNQYDAVLLPCEGAENAHNTQAPNLVSYTNIGGKVFTTHFGYVWLATPSSGVAQNSTSFFGTANWMNPLNPSVDYNDPMTGTIDQSFPKGQAFAQWLVNVGASTTAGTLSIAEPRHNAKSAINPPSQRWMYGNSTSTTSTKPDMLLSMTFNTPTTAAPANQCGRVVFSDFHVSASALVSGGGSCNADTDCGVTSTCTPPVVGTCSTQGCASTSGCSDTGATCVGAVTGNCAPLTCTTSSDCGGGVCVSGTCRCTRRSHCGASGSGTCTLASYGTCGAKSCTSSTQCGASETCSGGTCQPKTCTTSCTSGTCVAGKCQCTSDTQCGSGTCTTYGSCNALSCVQTECGTSRSCVGGVPGTCTHNCTTDSQCATAGTTCKAGKCLGCVSSNDCPGTSATCAGGVPGTCSATSNMFPLTCRNGNLSAQEKALEFMLFDLTACVSPDSWTPPMPTTVYNSVTFTQDFTGTCKQGQRVVWREFDWQDQIPTTASIDFSAQTANTTATLASAQSVTLAHATATTSLPAWDVALLDTKTGGVFASASPPVLSQNLLRVTITLNPTSDKKASPTLNSWKVQYDCVDAE